MRELHTNDMNLIGTLLMLILAGMFYFNNEPVAAFLFSVIALMFTLVNSYMTKKMNTIIAQLNDVELEMQQDRDETSVRTLHRLAAIEKLLTEKYGEDKNS